MCVRPALPPVPETFPDLGSRLSITHGLIAQAAAIGVRDSDAPQLTFAGHDA